MKLMYKSQKQIPAPTHMGSTLDPIKMSALRATWLRGYVARLEGRSKDYCQYASDQRGSSAYHKAWMDGYEWASFCYQPIVLPQYVNINPETSHVEGLEFEQFKRFWTTIGEIPIVGHLTPLPLM